jgi:SpoVK/Ycf46/Vps4 family AAA+-type ATPase
MAQSKLPLERWTRHGILTLPWSPFETPEKLAQAPAIRETLARLTESFARGRESFHALRLPWRRGLFLYGPPGSGKSAAGRAAARALNWRHLTVPAHEILDAHLLERALADALGASERVIVLEDVDQMIHRMETDVFFTLVDHAFERSEGQLWVATSRRPEDAPKTQLVRPGRFETSIHLAAPPAAVRKETLMSFLLPFFTAEPAGAEGVSIDEEALADLVARTEGLSFAHFEELRQVCARLKLESREAELWPAVHEYLQDQLIAGDRWGGAGDLRAQVDRRVAELDPRVLMAAIEVTDVFRTLMDKVIGDAAERAREEQAETGTA